MNPSIDDLMKPRYEVIARFRMSPFLVGDVLELENGKYVDIFDIFWTAPVFDKYPHLFKKLQWWERRSPDEMPEYVKPNKLGDLAGYDGMVLKVIDWLGDPYDAVLVEEFPEDIDIEFFQPATLQDYITYTQNKKP